METTNVSLLSEVSLETIVSLGASIGSKLILVWFLFHFVVESNHLRKKDI